MATLQKTIFTILLLSNLSYSTDIEKSLYKTACELDMKNISILACTKLANLYYDSKENKDENYKKARKYYDISCKGDEVSACYMLSAIYYQGLGVDKNLTKGNEYSLKACNLGSANGCHSVGYMLSTGVGTTKIDKKKSAIYLEKACQKNLPMACLQLTDYYSHAHLKAYSFKRIQEMYKQTQNSYKKLCDRKNGFSCGIVGKMYALGKGEEVNWGKANEYFKKECEYNNHEGGCIHLGYAYLNGTQIRNTTKAKELLKEGCQLEFGFACSLLGDMYFEKGDKNRANSFYAKAIKSHTELADEYNILYDFNKLYEISIIQNKKLDKNLEQKFLRLYKDYDDYLINYKILKLFEAIYHGKEPNIQKFIEKFKNVKLQKEQIGYEFPHLKIWIEHMEDKKMKKKLMELFKIIDKQFLQEAYLK